MRYYLIITLACAGSFFSHSCHAQHALFLLGGLEIPTNSFNYQFHQANNVLQQGWKETCDDSYTPSPLPSFNLALNYRFFGNFAIEIGTQITEMDFVAYDSRYISKYPTSADNEDDNGQNTDLNQGNFDVFQNYNSVWVAGYYYLKNRYTDFGPYIGGGISRNSLLHRSRTIAASYRNVETTDQLDMTVHYLPSYNSPFAEIGLGGTWTSRRNATKYMSLGIKYYWAGTVMSADYQHALGGSVDYTDHGTASGSFIAFTLRYGIDLVKKNQVGYSTTRYKHAAPSHRHVWFHSHTTAQPSKGHRVKSPAKKQKVTRTDNTRGW